MLANDGALVYSVELASTHVYSRHSLARPYCVQSTSTATAISKEDILRSSDVVITAVPGSGYKVPTGDLKHGAVCVDLSERGNFEANVKTKVGGVITCVVCWRD
jgi:methylenetetrahydrofolate dehydrogenase (NAD+)